VNREQRRAAERNGRRAARARGAGLPVHPRRPSLDLLGLATLIPAERLNAPTVEPAPEVFDLRGVEDL
jgi:hypothetical protein